MSYPTRDRHIQYFQAKLATCAPEEKEKFEIHIALLQTDISGSALNAFWRMDVERLDERLKGVSDNWESFYLFADRLNRNELDASLLQVRNFGAGCLAELKQAVAKVLQSRQGIETWTI